MPLSNCEVGGGIAPVPELVESGVTVGLGSDGYIDDFFEVMRGAFLIHKAKHQNPQVMPAKLVWYLATEGGAKALGLEKIGRIEPGWQADLQLIEADLPTPVKEHNLYEQLLLYCNAEKVRGVLVAGDVKVKDGEVLNADWNELQAHSREAAARLWEVA
jgi:5-methylthioadenosine/S-adenosylhomocysteine deaminase